MPGKAKGKVVTLVSDRGFGFIRPDAVDSRKDIFFHASGMANRQDFDELQEGMDVQYGIDDSQDRPRACEVEVLG